MPNKPLLHPKRDDLIAFGLGTLKPGEATKIGTHLEECETCCSTLLNLKDDTFVDLVRKSPVSARLSEQTQADPAHPMTGAASDDASNDSGLAPTMLEGLEQPATLADLPLQLQEHPRYRIVELIGKGGMGDVYRAEHTLMNRPVALKLINSQLVRRPEAVERFRREVQAAARLAHPNIVTAFDAEQAGDVHFLVMEFVEGTDLASLVKERGPLPVAEACDCIRQAALGLQHAHEKGMVHRDIKPHNLMGSSSGQIRILDFGLAGFVTESALLEVESTESEATPESPHLTSFGSMMGTPDYIAPEQARDAHSADIRADIYSLGCTLCYLLTGKAPFAAADSVGEKIKAHAEQMPATLAHLRSDVPPELDLIVRRMMAKSPTDRFQTPAEVAQALHSYAGTQQSTAAPPKPPNRVKRSILITGIVLLAGVLLYLATDTGKLEIDTTGVDIPGARIVLLRGGKEYATFKVNSDQNFQSIWAGEYEVQLRNAPDDVKFNVWTKPGDTNDWGGPDAHELEPIAVYRGSGMMIQVRRREPQAVVLTDHDRLQGTWVAESGQRGGQAMPIEQIGLQRAIFNGDQLRVLMPGGLAGEPGLTGEGVFELKTAIHPKEIWIQVNGRSDGMRGIYQLDGDQLTLCMNQDRRGIVPSDFTSPPGTTVDLIVMRRIQESVLPGTPGGPTIDVTVRPEIRQKLKDLVNAARQASTDENGRDSTTLIGRSNGILTHPPSVPVGGLPVGQNLVLDASLEDTPTGSLPQGWSAWLNEGPDFKCEVVEGGMTGNHCLQISGTGTRGVVFCTSLPLDRTKRYTLKGQVKVEGEAGTWAVIKLNYFNKGGWLGVDDRGGVTSSDLDWKFFEKTDQVDRYPTATLIVPTCHIEGNGTAWFDELEVIAYDRESLPDDFDARHGKNNRMK